jgi:hypothetical protein
MMGSTSKATCTHRAHHTPQSLAPQRHSRHPTHTCSVIYTWREGEVKPAPAQMFLFAPLRCYCRKRVEILVTLSMASPPAHELCAVEVAATPRKRRRGPAGHAAEDCFRCTKRNIKCDRRRPYCSQCLAIGNGCSGYRTKLTWGLGVASRGKHRGLSLPLTNGPPVARETQGLHTQQPRSSSGRAFQHQHQLQVQQRQWSGHDNKRTALGRPVGELPVPQGASVPMTPNTVHPHARLSVPRENQGRPAVFQPLAAATEHPESIFGTATEDPALSIGFVDGLTRSHTDYSLPMSQPYSGNWMTFIDTRSNLHDGYHGACHSSPIPCGLSFAPVFGPSCTLHPTPGLMFVPSESDSDFGFPTDELDPRNSVQDRHEPQ